MEKMNNDQMLKMNGGALPEPFIQDCGVQAAGAIVFGGPILGPWALLAAVAVYAICAA